MINSTIIDDVNLLSNRWLVLPITIIGILGNLINVLVFTRPVFNHHVCSWYFCTLAMNNFVYSAIVLLYRLLTDGFQISFLVDSPSLCRAVSFIGIFARGMSHSLIILAAIDRYCASSSNVQRRKFNSFHVIPWAILSVVLFFLIFAISAPITVDLTSFNGLGCLVRFTTAYNKFYVLLQFILFVILSPLLMIIFALLTRRHRRLMGELPPAVSRCRRMEYHLTGTLLILVPVHLILNLSECVDYILIFQPNLVSSTNLIQTIVRIPIFISYAIPIVCYLIGSREYRRELNKMLPVRYPQVNVHGEHDQKPDTAGIPRLPI